MTATDFQTLGASSLMTGLVMTQGPDTAHLVPQVDQVSDALGNTREVARNAYSHPEIPHWYETGALERYWSNSRSSRWMDRSEHTLLRCLEE